MDPAILQMWLSLWRLFTIIGTYLVTKQFGLILGILAGLVFYAGHEQLEEVYGKDESKDAASTKSSNDKYFNRIKINDHARQYDDSFKWINDILMELWLNNQKFAENFLRNEWPDIIHKVCKNLPSLFHEITLETFYIGDNPIEIHNIHVWEEADDIVLDMDIKYEGNARVTIKFDTIALPVTIQDIRIQSAKMRMVLKNVTHQLPIISAVHFAFIEPPQFDWTIDSFVHLDCIDKRSFDLIRSKLINRIVLPRKLILPVEMPLEIMQKLNNHFAFKTNVSNQEALMLKPAHVVKITVLKIKNMVVRGTTIVCRYGEKNHFGTYTDPSKIEFTCYFPIEYVHRQKLQIEVTDGHTMIGEFEENFETILKTKTSAWYGLENCQGQIKLNFENFKIPETNEIIPMAEPFGVLSLFLKNFRCSEERKCKPVIYVNLEQSDVILNEEYTSLVPFSSSHTDRRINEGTLFCIENILDENSVIKFKIWDSKNWMWLGQEIIIKIRDLIGKPFQEIDLEMDHEMVLTFVTALYHK